MIVTTIHRDVEKVVDMLVDKKQIVGIFQGESEWGPRALGNRLILFDPRHLMLKQL